MAERHIHFRLAPTKPAFSKYPHLLFMPSDLPPPQPPPIRAIKQDEVTSLRQMCQEAIRFFLGCLVMTSLAIAGLVLLGLALKFILRPLFIFAVT